MSIKAQLLISKKGENKLLKSEVNVKRVFSYTCVIFIQNAADYKLRHQIANICWFRKYRTLESRDTYVFSSVTVPLFFFFTV